MTAKSVLLRPQSLRPRARALSPPLATLLGGGGLAKSSYNFYSG